MIPAGENHSSGRSLVSHLSLWGGVIATLLLLSGCGGGGTSVTDSPEPRTTGSGSESSFERLAGNAENGIDSIRGFSDLKSGSVFQTSIGGGTFDLTRNDDGSYRITLPTRGGGQATLASGDGGDGVDQELRMLSLQGQSLEGVVLEDGNGKKVTGTALYTTEGFGGWLAGGYFWTFANQDDLDLGAYVDWDKTKFERTLPRYNVVDGWTYNGKATGLYFRSSEGGKDMGNYIGDVVIRLTFADNNAIPNMSGEIKNLEGGNLCDPAECDFEGITIMLENANINGTGDVVISRPDNPFSNSEGTWNGIHLENEIDQGWTVVGTHAVTGTDDEGDVGFSGFQIAHYQ